VLGVTLAALFVVLNGIFVAAEFALVKLRATHATTQPKKGDWRSAVVSQAIERLDRFLGVTQLGVTLASLGLGWIGEPALADLGDGAVRAAMGEEPPPAVHAVVLGLSFALLTFVHVLFGELVPKLVAIQRSRQAALVAVPLLRFVYIVLYPALFLLETASRGILRLIGLPFDAYSEGALSEDEIVGIMAANVVPGRRGEAKRELFRRVMRFSERTAKSAMIPRVDVASLPITATVIEALEFVRQQQYSRVLLYQGSLDQVVGYLYVKDLLFGPGSADLPDLTSIKREVLFVPESQGLVDVLGVMQRAHTPFAVVVDEYGGTSGIVTMEDILEEIVGDIRDELDVEAARIEKRDDGWEVEGDVILDELRTIGLDPEEDERGSSVGAIMVARLKRLPRIGDRADLAHGFVAEVRTLSRRRVTRVRIRPPPAAPEATE
jgi:CBS domain containing-hemolysin-like protein